ncbi:MAG: MaoC family dehydratase N-terminal domain-containing protein [Pseudomonadota bacterium]
MQPDLNAQQRQSDILDVARANALRTTLSQPASLRAGDPLPHLFHQIYFWEPVAADGLGRDGHPKVGGLIPDMGLPRRMWASGRLAFHSPLLVGQEAVRHTTCESALRKTGRSGRLAFVTLRHEIHQSERHCLTEWQELVYREDPKPGDPVRVPPVARVDEEVSEEVTFSSTVLFRYSALTFNGHRIHYDLDYARDVEGYKGLVVHGPLLAQLLLDFAERALGQVTGFQFRATAPLMHFETASLCRTGQDLWVRGPGGRQCMVAQVS